MSFDFNFDGIGDSIKNHMFRKVKGLVYSLQTGQVAIKGSDGALNTVIKGPTGSPIIAKNLDIFSLKIPAFATTKPIDQIQLNDIVLTTNGKPKGFVTGFRTTGDTTEVRDGETVTIPGTRDRIEILTIGGNVQNISPPQIQMMGMFGNTTGIPVVQNLFGTIGNDNPQSVQNNLMQMMLMGKLFGKDEDSTVDSFMPMFLMSGGNLGGLFGGGAPATGSTGAANPLGGIMQMMGPMMMMKGMGSLFGGSEDSLEESV